MNKYFLLLKEIYINKALLKFNLLALTYMLAMALSVLKIDFLNMLIFFLLFFILYSSVYYYNDLVDYENDKKKKVIHRTKLLAKGYFTKREYKIFLIFSSFIGVLLLSSISIVYAILSLLLIGFNHFRTNYAKTFNSRIFTLFWIEFYNLVVFWFVLTGEIFNAFAYPLFALYSFAYMISYYFYKKYGKLSKTELIRYLPLFLFLLYFSTPLLIEKGLIIPLILGLSAYVILTGINMKSRRDINELTFFGIIGITISTLLFLSYPLFQDKLSGLSSSMPQGLKTAICDTPELILENLQSNYSIYAPVFHETLSSLEKFSIFKFYSS